jgi:hypothetical protein
MVLLSILTSLLRLREGRWETIIKGKDKFIHIKDYLNRKLNLVEGEPKNEFVLP